MSCAIHHGGGVGTYKTFSVLQRHAIPQLLNGRIVVSTVRGFDSIRVIEAVMDVSIPDSSELIFVDLETVEGIEKIRRWWEWVPVGAYIIIDEAQLIYPKSKKITIYDYPSSDGLTGDESAVRDSRPNGFLQAFTMQRHYNWDLAIITPNIKMLVNEIREVSQVAYEHKYMGALLPWAKHGWREIQHSPMSTGKGSSYPPVRYNADKRVYKTYQSTKTGNHANSGAELSIFKNPKLLSVFALAGGSLIVFFYLLSNVFYRSDDGQGDVLVFQETSKILTASINSDVSVRNSSAVRPVKLVSHVESTSFQTDVMSIVGKFFDEYIIEVGLPPNEVQFSTSYLYKNGVKLNIINDCLIELTFDEIIYNVRCPLHRRVFKQQIEQTPVNVIPFGALTGS